MAFTRGLFYPWIDIENEGWLKTAALYWDNIQTIVPRGLEQPYQVPAARALYDEQVLEPFIVESHMRDVEALTDSVLKYLETPEGLEVLSSGPATRYQHLHRDKLPSELQQILRMHPAKLPDYVRDSLRRGVRRDDRDEWIPVDRRFAWFYMTLLATRISERHGLGLLTDTGAMDGLATTAKLDAHQTARPRWSRIRHAGRDANWDVPPMLAQGMLAHLVLEGLEIDPETSIETILKFRREHSDELGSFRTKIAELTASITDAQPVNRVKQQVEDQYKNEVGPAIHSLKRALTGSKIRYTAENFLKVSFFSIGGTSLPLNVLGISAPYALLDGAGVSLTAFAILYNLEKERQLSESPYAYVLAAGRMFD